MNDDLIKRQDAIDALNGEISVTGRANAEAILGYLKLVADRIKRLPPAYGCEHTVANYCPNCGARLCERREDG